MDYKKLLIVFGASAALVACGGGGDTGGDSEPANEPADSDAQETSMDTSEDTGAMEVETPEPDPAPEPDPVPEPEPEPQATDAGGADDGAAFMVAGLTGDAAAGRRVWTRCMSCHVLDEGVNRVGPSLYGIFGREAGTVEGFRYSDANLGSGVTWTAEVMFEYLENPAEFMPGTRMAFPGLPDGQQRADLIAYIKENGGEG